MNEIFCIALTWPLDVFICRSIISRKNLLSRVASTANCKVGRMYILENSEAAQCSPVCLRLRSARCRCRSAYAKRTQVFHTRLLNFFESEVEYEAHITLRSLTRNSWNAILTIRSCIIRCNLSTRDVKKDKSKRPKQRTTSTPPRWADFSVRCKISNKTAKRSNWIRFRRFSGCLLSNYLNAIV